MGMYITPIEKRRIELEKITRLEGTKIWQQQKEYNRRKHLQEQQEVRELLENYWPWGRPGGGAPNNVEDYTKKNVNLVEMFANEELQKAKRQTGPQEFQFGSQGGGAPHFNKVGQKQTRFREDPALRFQWGDDLRKTVDNTLRYRSRREEQEQYRKQLDAMVEEKIKAKEREKKKKLEYERKMGWTSDSTIRQIQENVSPKPREENQSYQPSVHHQHYQNHHHHKHQFVQENDYQDNVVENHSNNSDKNSVRTKRSTENSKQNNGIELVPLIIRRRQPASKTQLASTDVTRGDAMPRRVHIPEPKYLNTLTQQVHQKYQQEKAAQVEDVQSNKQHFETWDTLWGRPGHGAPRSANQKGRLMAMLYPQMQPMPVH